MVEPPKVSILTALMAKSCILCFLLTPPDLKEQHLQLMKNFASQIRKRKLCEFLHQNTTTKGAIDLLKEFEDR